jgi:hypothetical protein
MTTITEEGKFRYRVAPQGFVASGDGYNARYDDVLSEVPRKAKCVDDLALWDKDLETHWWRIVDHLEMVSKNGIILNPENFEFCAHEIEYAGFRVTDKGVLPLGKYLDSIRNFKRPQNIMDIRSYFGLMNQVAHYAQLRAIMQPFRVLLTPKTKFFWDSDMETAFEASKKEIVEAIKTGVATFDLDRKTALSPDWSKTGMGYFLYQKYCDCNSDITTCCETGWRVVLAGSRFLNKAEENYWPTEGEALAVAWSLEDTRFFTAGCKDLHIQTDHRPLVSLLGEKPLDEIHNRCLVSFKERTFPWKFSIHWVLGKIIPAPDAVSRSPDSPSLPQEAAATLAGLRRQPDEETLDQELAAAARSTLGGDMAVTWEWVKEETARDIHLQEIINLAVGGNMEDMAGQSAQVAQYHRYRDGLSTIDGVLTYNGRPVIPPCL